MDSNRFIAFDVETPNSCNNRMSSIGIAVVENGMICDTFSSIVNPETYFDWFNIKLTGITPKEAEKAPTFGELWPTLEEYLGSGLLIAHNAPFDMSVLAKCIRAYCVDWYDKVEYACTVRMGKAGFPELPNHKLDTMSRFLGIELDHHRADSDSIACAEIMLRCFERGVDVRRFRRVYDMNSFRTVYRY